MKNNEAVSIGIIGEPDENTPKMLEEIIGKPVKMRKKKDKIIVIIGKGLFKKKIVLPIKND